MYIVVGPGGLDPNEAKMVDLSHVAFDDNTWSKIQYGLLMASSLTSVSISLARVLRWGKDPVINHVFSFAFLKIIIMIFSRFFLQCYLLSMSIKSLMFFVVIPSLFKDELHDEQFSELFELYYKGITSQSPSLLTFTSAALYAPLILLAFQFLPPFLYTIVLSLKFYGINKLFSNFVDNPVIFLIPLLTNFSFFDEGCRLLDPKAIELGNEEESKGINIKSLKKHKSLVNLSIHNVRKENIIATIKDEDRKKEYTPSQGRRKLVIRSISCPNLSFQLLDMRYTKLKELKFSLFQSNVFYIMYFVGTFLCLLGDAVKVWAKHQGRVTEWTQVSGTLLMINLILWIDLNINKNNKQCFGTLFSQSNMARILEDIIQDSTDTILCIIITPIFVFINGVR